MNNIDISKIKAILLDLDGTLINTEKAFSSSFIKILKEKANVEITMEDYKKYELEQNAMLLKVLRDKNKLNGITDEEIMKFIYEDYKIEFEKIILEQDSIHNFELLKKLKEFKLALVTTSRRFYLNILISKLGLENLFEVIIAREDAQNLKPAPDAYLMAIDYLGIPKEECIALEDSKRGIDAAINAGIKTIQVSNFTTIKYIDERAIQYDSAADFFEEIKEKCKKLKK